jgi:NAD(P)-dependent dehydrogenase (short-subunit alcohol dehydrogenase family)
MMDSGHIFNFVLTKTEQMTSLTNKKVIVAGGSSGIGLATARLLAQQQAVITVTGRDTEKLKAIHVSDGFNTATVDSTNRAALDTFFKQAGNTDHLIVSISGHKGMGHFATLPLQELQEGFDNKFWPQLHTVQAALPYMNKGGSITLITAMSALGRLPGASGLAALNGGLELMVPILAKELKPLRINAVSPGVVDTPWWNFLPEENKQQTFQQFAQQIPVGRIARPEEIADTILFVLHNEYMTGAVIPCDGGLHC